MQRFCDSQATGHGEGAGGSGGSICRGRHADDSCRRDADGIFVAGGSDLGTVWDDDAGAESGLVGGEGELVGAVDVEVDLGCCPSLQVTRGIGAEVGVGVAELELHGAVQLQTCVVDMGEVDLAV